MNAPLRVAIADDHLLFRQGLRVALELDKTVSVVGETDRADDIEPMITRTSPDVLLLDLRMDRSTLPDVPRFAALLPVVVVTASERRVEGVEAMRRGARAVVYKVHAFETLMEATRRAAAGHVWLPPELHGAMADQLRDERQSPLTPRERQIVRLVALGRRNAEVARELGLSEATVKVHLHRVFEKLAIRDRVSLTLYAARIGLITVAETER